MILLYLLSLVTVLVLFVPVSIIPVYIKWPCTFAVVFLIVFLFNVLKKDTIYLVKDSKKKIINRGLFNPLLLYVSASLYIFGFVLISTQLKYYNVTDYIGEFDLVKEVFATNSVNNILMGLLLVSLSILMYYLRYLFKSNAESSTLRSRAVVYLCFTTILVLIGLINSLSFSNFILADYLKTNLNYAIFFGLIGLVLLIDFVGLLIRISLRRRRLINSLVKELRPDPVEPTVELVLEEKEISLSKKELKIAKKQAEIDKIVAKKVALIDEKRTLKLAKNEKETKKEIADEIIEEELEVVSQEVIKLTKKEIKQAKKDKKIADRDNKNERKFNKKIEKINKKVNKLKRKIQKIN